jgi:hypothetical protein
MTHRFSYPKVTEIRDPRRPTARPPFGQRDLVRASLMLVGDEPSPARTSYRIDDRDLLAERP